MGMVGKDSPVEQTLRNFCMNCKFCGEGWSEERMRENNVDYMTISEPTDSYMITSV